MSNSDVQGQAFPRGKAQLKPRPQGNVGSSTQRASQTASYATFRSLSSLESREARKKETREKVCVEVALCKGSLERAYYGSLALGRNQMQWPLQLVHLLLSSLLAPISPSLYTTGEAVFSCLKPEFWLEQVICSMWSQEGQDTGSATKEMSPKHPTSASCVVTEGPNTQA